MKDKYFIAVYTNEVKDYCDLIFFENLYLLSQGQAVVIVDNTIGLDYFNKLNSLFTEKQFTNFKLYHIDVSEHPKESQFQRNVCDSVNMLRDKYTDTNLPYFFILESDVKPPLDVLEKFDTSINELEMYESNWGILGGLYYEGFHQFNFDGASTFFQQTKHCLSGCTLYKRSVIENYSFRYNPYDLAPFPDAFMSLDAGEKFTLWNDHRIHCEHLHNLLNGTRASKNL